MYDTSPDLALITIFDDWQILMYTQARLNCYLSIYRKSGPTYLCLCGWYNYALGIHCVWKEKQDKSSLGHIQFEHLIAFQSSQQGPCGAKLLGKKTKQCFLVEGQLYKHCCLCTCVFISPSKENLKQVTCCSWSLASSPPLWLTGCSTL